MASYTRDDAPSFWEKWTGWRLRERAVDDGPEAGRWGSLRRHDGGSEGDRCTISVIHNYKCNVEPSEEGGAPVRKCERTKKVLRHCLGKPPEVIESSTDVKVTDSAAADLAPTPIIPGPAWNEAGVLFGNRGERPLDAEFFRLFGHNNINNSNNNAVSDENTTAELPSSAFFSPSHGWWFGVPDEGRESTTTRESVGEPRGGDYGTSLAMEEAFRRAEEMLCQSGMWPGKGEEHIFGHGRQSQRGGCPYESERTQDGNENEKLGKKDGKQFAEYQKDFYEV